MNMMTPDGSHDSAREHSDAKAALNASLQAAYQARQARLHSLRARGMSAFIRSEAKSRTKGWAMIQCVVLIGAIKSSATVFYRFKLA